MTRTYCTLFDRNYLYQAVALYRSLLRNATDFKLYALCMDATAHALLKRMQSDTLIPVGVEELLTPEVAAVRARTTHGQFCWVCQPLVCEWVLDRSGADMVTYLEADSLFFSDPQVLFDEMGDCPGTLVPHNFSAEFDNQATAGRFCVQFNAFRNNVAGRSLLAYWRESCFKYDKSAPTVYPGQTSLDDWPIRFPEVCVITHPGAGVAPWNVRGYALGVVDSVPHVDGRPVVFYHFHQYGRYRNGAHELGSYPLTRAVIDSFYRPYVDELRRAESVVRQTDGTFGYRREYADCNTLGRCLEVLKRKARRRYNVYPDAYFS